MKSFFVPGDDFAPIGRTAHPFWPAEFSREEREIVSYVASSNITMLSPERLFSVVLSCRWIVANDIRGDFVECGVWRGGASILVGLWLEMNGISSKKLWLYDTFSGMTAPQEEDVRTRDGKSFEQIIEEHEAIGLSDDGIMAYASIEDVKNNLKSAGVSLALVNFVPGDVAKTLTTGDNLPEQIAMLRLDTDWYASTLLELEMLYPRLERNGPLLIDDYGYYDGCRKAVEHYFDGRQRPYFHLDDEYGRTGLKP